MTKKKIIVMIGTMVLPMLISAESKDGRAYEYKAEDQSESVIEENLDMFTEDELEYVLSDCDKNVSSDVTYLKTTTVANGKDVSTVSEEYYSEEEFLEAMRNFKVEREVTFRNRGISTHSSIDLRYDKVETTMKKIELNMFSVDASVKKVRLKCTWLSIPKCKSFDIIALKPSTGKKVCTNVNPMILLP